MSSGSFTPGDHVRTGGLDSGSGAAESHSTRARTEVLENEDILEQIFSFFHQAGGSWRRIPFPASSHLVQASLVRKSFFDPAMNVLWRSMNSLNAVLGVVPFLKLEEGVYSTDLFFNVKDLHKLKRYTYRIRHFRFTPLKGMLSPELFYMLSKKLDGPLFPTLKTLDCRFLDQIPVDKRSAMFLLTTPTLSELVMGGINSVPDTFSDCLLESLVEAAQSITVLKLHGSWAGRLFDSNAGGIVARHSSTLKRVHIDGSLHLYSWATTPIHHLSHMTSLTALVISFEEVQALPLFNSVERRPKLASLEDLHVLGRAKDLAAAMGSYIFCPGLKTISISLYPASEDETLPMSITTDAQAHHIEQAIQTVIATSPLLECIWLRAPLQHTQNSPAVGVSKALPTLHSCKRLRELDISCCRARSIGPVLRDLCSELTFLEILKVQWSAYSTDEDESFTLLLLEDLAKACKTLKVIHIPILIANGPPDIEVMQRRITEEPLNHGLEELMLNAVLRLGGDNARAAVHDGVPNTVAVSRYIDHLFPVLRVFKWQGFPYNESVWVEGIKVMINAYQDVRRLAKDRQAGSSNRSGIQT